jgi:Uma2 family endonuclease
MAVETAVASPEAVETGQVDGLPIWRISVAQYHAMAEAGILDADDPVELLEGYLVAKVTKSPAHRLAKRLVRLAIEALLPRGWYIESEDPVTTVDSEPEPDAVVVRGQDRDYATRHPGPGDVALVVEVADSSLHRDRTAKRRIYARAGIPVYWIVNLVDRRIEVYTAPSGPGEAPDYAERADYGETAAAPVLIDGRAMGEVHCRHVLP